MRTSLKWTTSLYTTSLWLSTDAITPGVGLGVRAEDQLVRSISLLLMSRPLDNESTATPTKKPAKTSSYVYLSSKASGYYVAYAASSGEVSTAYLQSATKLWSLVVCKKKRTKHVILILAPFFFFFLRDRHRGIIGGLTVQGHREEFENRCPRLYILDYHARAGNCLLCPNYCHLAGLGPIMFLWSHGIRFWALACGRYWGRKTPEKPTECWMVEVLFPIR